MLFQKKTAKKIFIETVIQIVVSILASLATLHFAGVF